ncbi:hypothetical protein MJG53_012616 [Ovis ammon polii x Ovis aries]|uniref:Uncharacterized protein n=1 Tax=Ovis ammon polii x Ovis aries TaxID=2918886 RepID=A0ACB9ULE3_9CETA|nr:hypothetical protein MJG53_012616 [Ovis ammon polii x Ovis aries]
MLTMCPSSGLGTKPIVASACTGAAALHSVPFSLGASEGGGINWRVFIWCICFTVTLTLFIGEFCGLRSRLPFSWDGFLCTHALYFSISCLSTSIIFGATYIKYLSPGSAGNWVITATAFAFVAAALYPLKRSASYPAWRHGRFKPAFPGLLRRPENYAGWLIIAFISSPHQYQHQRAIHSWWWTSYASSWKEL